MKIRLALIVSTFAISALGLSAANAAVIFSDNFNSYSFQGNWAPSANWAAPLPGTVDLIGETTTATAFDFFPGNGGYVDLGGSAGVAGTLQTLQSFAAGSYTLTFDLGGNARGDGAKTTNISLGNWSTMLILASDAGYSLYTYTFATTGGTLNFSDLAGGNGSIGNILDNVSLSSVSLSSAVPEPATWAMFLLGFGAVGFAMRRRKRLAFAI